MERISPRLLRAQGLVDDHISCITVDKSGKLWFGTHGQG